MTRMFKRSPYGITLNADRAILLQSWPAWLLGKEPQQSGTQGEFLADGGINGERAEQ